MMKKHIKQVYKDLLIVPPLYWEEGALYIDDYEIGSTSFPKDVREADQLYLKYVVAREPKKATKPKRRH
jgi:hypothetical protein